MQKNHPMRSGINSKRNEEAVMAAPHDE